jgi:diadenosine tetraphosphate (Ap4A) HIT family hydrolase
VPGGDGHFTESGTPSSPSPFLQVPREQWLASNEVAFAIADRFPVNPGHTLVVPHRLVGTWWEVTPTERTGLLELVDVVKEILDREHRPDGYNVGFNAGAAAGQTVDHLHVHVIPRFVGDTFDPRGGIRHALPGRGNYLTESDPSLLDNQERSVLDALRDCLGEARFDQADLIVSFVMRSGLTLIGDDLQEALDRGVRIRLLTTDYLEHTEPDALARLLDLAEDAAGRLEVRVFSDEATSFHPKGYLFRSSTTGVCRSLVGSSNLSRSGISIGIEWTLATHLDAGLAAAFERAWADRRNVPLTHEWLRSYRLRVPIPTTAKAPAELLDERLEPAILLTPRPIQVEALEAITASVAQGHRAGSSYSQRAWARLGSLHSARGELMRGACSSSRTVKRSSVRAGTSFGKLCQGVMPDSSSGTNGCLTPMSCSHPCSRSDAPCRGGARTTSI